MVVCSARYALCSYRRRVLYHSIIVNYCHINLYSVLLILLHTVVQWSHTQSKKVHEGRYRWAMVALVGWVTHSAFGLTNNWPICSLIILHCGQFIFRKVSKIVDTRCQILRIKCTKFAFHWGSALEPAGGAYGAPTNPITAFKEPTSKGRERGRKGKGGDEVEGGIWPTQKLRSCFTGVIFTRCLFCLTCYISHLCNSSAKCVTDCIRRTVIFIFIFHCHFYCPLLVEYFIGIRCQSPESGRAIFTARCYAERGYFSGRSLIFQPAAKNQKGVTLNNASD